MNARVARSGAQGLAALVMAGALAGCDVGPQSAPQALNARQVPYALHPPSHRSPVPVEPGLREALVTVYMEGRNDRLVAVVRRVAYPVTLEELLGALANGPSAVESNQGMVSPASSVGPLGVGLPRDGVVPVYLPASFASLGGQDQVVAAAQIVYTVTGVRGVRGALVYVGGVVAQVPKADGNLANGPLTRSDYAPMAP